MQTRDDPSLPPPSENNEESYLMPSQNLAPGDVLVPRPDPTKLTTDAVRSARNDIEKLFDSKISALESLVIEKFVGVANDFAQRDAAVKAALRAADSSVQQQTASSSLAAEKMAAAFTKQIDSLDEKIDDLKDRLNSNTGHITGIRDMGGWLFGATMLIVAIGTLATTLLRHL